MTTNSNPRLAEISKRLEGITPGEWRVFYKHNTLDVHTDNHREIVPWMGFDSAPGTWDERKANADFIAHAPADIRFLLREITELRSALKAAIALSECDRESRVDVYAFKTTIDHCTAVLRRTE